jgi:hypothetical protein
MYLEQFGMLGETETQRQERLYREGLLTEVVVTPNNAGQNAAAGYKPEVLAEMNRFTIGNIIGMVFSAAGLYCTIAGTVNLFSKRYAGHRLRYAGGYLVLGTLSSGIGYLLNQDRINRILKK